jgi:signal transduction histidine kinase
MDDPPLRVLLIEDDEDDYLLIGNLLAQATASKCELKWVATYESALEALGGDHHVCLLDYRLGNHNGLELLREAQLRGCAFPIILVTALDSHSLDKEAMIAGASDFLVKGHYTADMLERSIRYSLNRKQSEASLQSSAEKTKLFASCVSHDLRSLTVGIQGMARLLNKQYRSTLDDRGAKYCDQILRASGQVVALVDEINAFLQTREVPLAIEDVNFKEIIETIREEFAPQLASRSIAWSEPDTAPEIRVDRLSLLRLLRNLVDNALKYGGRKLSAIRVGYEELTDSHACVVYDDGAGIKTEHHERIFDAFHRGRSATGVPGTGLGLAIVKEIAERHHGRVWVESVPERGSKFVVAIPKNL